jgi:putative transcriptional regulator
MKGKLDNRIRVFRAEHRLSQSDLAEQIGVTRKTISTIEVGRFVPSTIIALKIARFFGIPVEQIFSLTDFDVSSLSPVTSKDKTNP